LGNFYRRPSQGGTNGGLATVDAYGNDFVTPSLSTTASPSPITSATQCFLLPATPSISQANTPLPIAASNIYTVGLQGHEYVNALVVCPKTHSKLFVGASDGSLMIYEIIWPPSGCDRLLQLRLITSFSAHTKEIDDLAIDLYGNYLVTVSRDHHIYVRQCEPPFDTLSELDIKQFGCSTRPVSTKQPPSSQVQKSPFKYRIRHVRFGIKPKDEKNICYLYTSIVPQSIVDKLKSYICQWVAANNTSGNFVVVKKRLVSYERISAMAVSDDGLYLAIGDSGGYVRIFDTQSSSSFHLLHEQHSHSIFVTDLTFILKHENYVYATSVLSISADKNLYLHNVHKQQTNLASISFFVGHWTFIIVYFVIAN